MSATLHGNNCTVGHTPSRREIEGSTTAPAMCKAGKHTFSPENRTKNRHCRLCKREQERERYRRTRVLKRGKPCPRWDGTVVHLFILKWIRFEKGHWIWHHSINKVAQCPTLGRKWPSRNPVRLIWTYIGNPDIPAGYLLSRNRSRCDQPLCVHPSHHHVLKRGHHLPPEVRLKGPQTLRSQWAQVSLESEVAKRIECDDTRCWRWKGSFSGKPGERPRATFEYRGKVVSIRTYLWEREHGKVPTTHFLRHNERDGCSSPDECVSPNHLYLQDRREFGTAVGGRSRGRRPKRPVIGGLEWSGTLWDPDTAMNCRHCRRGFDYHGAPETVAKKLGVPLNQRHHICLPPHAKSTERPPRARPPRPTRSALLTNSR